ncbi:hypothetical protein APA_2384 [Pseudanabaena sp. lw0831]|nr:hypothetical protein APA_2384 [Pseudanabaena sp. lw0831]
MFRLRSQIYALVILKVKNCDRGHKSIKNYLNQLDRFFIMISNASFT